MKALDLINKKKNGETLSKEEIYFLINAFNAGDVPDYQMAALLMAIYFQGLNTKETTALTAALAESGEVLDFSFLGTAVADKHSSGGVGDKITLIMAPLVAAAGVPLAKISGRGLGFTGGTIDKLESIPGFSTQLPVKRFIELVQKNNLAIMAQTDKLTPAEGKLYALRDVTGTVENLSLIAASIMSKKIAAGADAILLDVKLGKGAFIQEREAAFQLAETMFRIGNEMGRQVVSVVTNMNQPLGFAVGNALEVKEALSVLSGEGPADLEQLSLLLGGYLLTLVDKVRNPDEGEQELARLLKSGAGLAKFKELVASQGGDTAYCDHPALFPSTKYRQKMTAPRAGYLREIHAGKIGQVAAMLGAGRFYKEQQIDPAAGIVLSHKVGDFVAEGETLACLHGNDKNIIEEALKGLNSAFAIGEERPEDLPLVYGVVPPFPC
ncbi:MAG: thymidine phosphorylase [Firmicutes bacterium]|nr:thymidine phosphorylase [Bacillota bacterium]